MFRQSAHRDEIPGNGQKPVEDVGRGLKVISVTQILSSNIVCPIINYCDAHLGWRYFKLFLPLEMSAWIILEFPCNPLKKYVILELEQSNILCQFIHLVLPSILFQLTNVF